MFDISAILWLALAAGLKILWDAPSTPVRRADRYVAVAAFLAALLPTAALSSIALAATAVWAIATAPPGSPLRRAGIIFLAMTGALIWGRLILGVFARPLLDLDAIFVSALLGSGHSGNLLWSAETGVRLAVAPGCSSMTGMSLALVFWATVNQFFEVRFGLKPLLWLVAALAATIGVNVLRIGAMLSFPAHLDAIHFGWGQQLAMWTALFAVVALCLYGARREVFAIR